MDLRETGAETCIKTLKKIQKVNFQNYSKGPMGRGMKKLNWGKNR